MATIDQENNSLELCIEAFKNGNFEGNCFKLFLSKALGFMIIGLSFTLKVPQIKNMLKSKSDKGLSYLATYSEIIIFLFNSLYSYHFENPISTYGESIVILFQTIIILFLTWMYSNEKSSLLNNLGRILFLIFMIIFTHLCIQDKYIHLYIWNFLGSSVIPLVSIARFSQIWVSYKEKSTGPLSIFTFMLNVLGNVARIFTTITETQDVILLFAYIYGVVLNLIIIFQIIIYSKNDIDKITPNGLNKINEKKEK